MLRITGSLSLLNNILRVGILTAGIFAAILFVFANQTKAQLDPTFGVNGLSTVPGSGQQVPLATFALSSGKILVVQEVDPSTKQYEFVRFNADGSLDGTFGSGGVVQLNVPFITTFGAYGIYGIVRQPDGKIILTGTDNGNGLVLRYNENGTLDSSFAGGGILRPNVNTSDTDTVYCGVVQSDGKILVGGASFNTSVTFFIRYNSDGTPDTGFGNQSVASHTGLSSFGYVPASLLMQSTGKFISRVGAFNGGKIRRFNADGSLDGGFPVLTTVIYGMAVQPDDKILVTSVIDKFESFDRSNVDPVISRFNPDGSVDSGFGTAGSLTFDWARYIDDAASTINILVDGQILVSGGSDISPNRSKYKGQVGTVALLSSTGGINGKFLVPGFRGVITPVGVGANNVAILPGGKVVFGGIFTLNPNNPINYDLQLAQITGVPLESYRFKPNPFDFKRSYDGVADPFVFRPSNQNWYQNGIFPGYPFGSPGDILAPADYIHKGFDTELAVFRPSNGTWYISPNYFGGPTNITAIQWGQNGDIPVPADFDGDAKADLAVFRPSDGAWYIRNSADNSVTALYWGLNGDKPVPGDYDGDGRHDIAVFRPSNGTWYIIRSTDGLLFVNFGLNGDVPVQDDYDYDGKTDISVWRPSTGVWYRINSSDNGIGGMQWGLSTDIAVPADYDGDFKTDISVWRPSEGRWYVFQSSTNAMSTFVWGLSTDIPVQARQ